jgi:septal ring factor EnvC (AmiA/AmiB activator)
LKKQIPALIAAILVTGFITLVMVVTGANALMNKSTTVIANAPAAAQNTSTSMEQAQIQQLQARINEYQQREQQYQQMLKDSQSQLQQAQDQLQQASAQMDSFRRFILVLQQRGVITIQSDGSVIINR